MITDLKPNDIDRRNVLELVQIVFDQSKAGNGRDRFAQLPSAVVLETLTGRAEVNVEQDSQGAAFIQELVICEGDNR